MADEIKVTMRTTLKKGAMRHDFNPGQFSLTQTGALVYDNVHAIGTGEETAGPTFGDIGTEGLCILHNLDTTNFVQVGFSTAVYGFKLYPSWAASVFTINPGATLYLKADTASCNVRICVYEY